MGAIDDPEWRARLAERKGQPNGEHIREDSIPEGVRLAGVTQEEFFTRLVEAVQKDRTDNPPPRSPWLAPPVLLTMAGMVATMVVFGCGSWWAINQNIASVKNEVSAALAQLQTTNAETYGKLAASVQTLQAAEEASQIAIRANQEAAEKRKELYAPQLEAEQRAQGVTDTRLDNMSKAMADIRDAMQDMAKIVTTTHTDVEVMKAREEMSPKGGPHER